MNFKTLCCVLFITVCVFLSLLRSTTGGRFPIARLTEPTTAATTEGPPAAATGGPTAATTEARPTASTWLFDEFKSQWTTEENFHLFQDNDDREEPNIGAQLKRLNGTIQQELNAMKQQLEGQLATISHELAEQVTETASLSHLVGGVSSVDLEGKVDANQQLIAAEKKQLFENWANIYQLKKNSKILNSNIQYIAKKIKTNPNQSGR